MGRIKSLMIKRAALQLLEKDAPFTSSFEYNKKLLINTMPSKPIRNKVAGYITRLIKTKAKVKKSKTIQEVPLEEARHY
jgi:ribosomal protein S17E